MKKIVFPLCLLAWSMVQPIVAAPLAASEESLFSTGKEMFELRNWNGCIDRLTQLRRQVVDRTQELAAERSNWAEASTAEVAYDKAVSLEEIDYMLAVASFEKGKLYAAELLSTFEKQYPVSRYLDEIRFLQGSRYFFSGNYEEAIATFDQISMDRVPVQYQPDYFQRLGVSLLHQKDYTKAFPLFKVLSQMDSKYRSSSTYYLGYIAYVEGRYDEALFYFQQVPTDGEYATSVPYYIAQIDFVKDRKEAALDKALALLQKDLSDEQAAEMHRIAAVTLFEQSRQERALQHFRQYFDLAKSPMRSASYVGGVSAYTAGDLALAKRAFSLVTDEEDILMQRAYLYLGQVYLQQGDMRSAQMAFERASKLSFDVDAQEDALFNYGLTVHKGSYSPFNESVTIFESFLNRFPQSEYTDQVNDCLVESYMTTRNYEAALKSIQQIQRPGHKIMQAKQRLLFQLATQLVANAKLQEAENYFTQAIQLGKLNQEVLAQAYFWRGECLYRKEKYQQAADDFSRFLSLTKNPQAEIYALGHYNLAYALFKQQKFDAAVRSFDKYLSIGSEKGKPTYADALNRTGDTYFYMRQFERAKRYYAQATEQVGGTADYATFQEAFMAGLQKNYPEKISLLESLQQKWPNSEYIDDALFEQGKTYVTISQPQNAIAAFSKLLDRFPNGSLARKSSLQLGLLYFNNNQADQAVKAYKHVIEKYPSSTEARLAAEDLKAVYVELNDIPSYAQYIQSLGGKVRFEAGEQDSLTYLAAERLLMKGNNSASEKALQNYLQSFEQGAFRLNALTELGRIYFQQKNYNQAAEVYERILQQPNTPFTEEALARTADILYMSKEYTPALQRFKQLDQMAEMKENKRAAQIGMMRCAVEIDDHKEAALAATSLLNQASLSPDLKNEASYNRAKALLAMGDQKAAQTDLNFLSKDTRTAFGAEAKYLLAQQAFDADKPDQAEKIVFELIDSATPHQYWLARGFILLADIYTEKKDLFQAKQYLESLKSNYQGEDDIEEMIGNRFQTIEKLSNEK